MIDTSYKPLIVHLGSSLGLFAPNYSFGLITCISDTLSTNIRLNDWRASFTKEVGRDN